MSQFSNLKKNGNESQKLALEKINNSIKFPFNQKKHINKIKNKYSLPPFHEEKRFTQTNDRCLKFKTNFSKTDESISCDSIEPFTIEINNLMSKEESDGIGNKFLDNISNYKCLEESTCSLLKDENTQSVVFENNFINFEMEVNLEKHENIDEFLPWGSKVSDNIRSNFSHYNKKRIEKQLHELRKKND